MEGTIAVIGLGSMGQRRIRILRSLYPAVRVIGIDRNLERAIEVGQCYEIELYKDISEIEVPVFAAFVCTSPESHHTLIFACLQRGWHVFSEINLVDAGYEKNMRMAEEKGKTLFLSSTPLYKDEMQYILQRVKTDGNRKIYLYHVGQYLPDWHPWDRLEDFFVSKKETNGCRELMAIELPWIVTVFGKVVNVKVIKRKVTDLDIDFPDTYLIWLFHEDGTVGNVVLDVVSRKAVRKLEIYNKNLYLSWEGTPDSLIEKAPETGAERKIDFDSYIHDERYGAFINEAAYVKEVEAFFEAVGGKKALYSFADDREIIRLINAIEAEP